MGMFSSDEFGYFEWEEEHQKVVKYKKVLKEIKEIAEEYEELHGFLDCSGDLILQKISECEEQ